MTIAKLIAEAEELGAKATPGPWEMHAGALFIADRVDNLFIVDKEFIARSRNLLPRAVAALKVAVEYIESVTLIQIRSGTEGEKAYEVQYAKDTLAEINRLAREVTRD